MTHRLLLQAQLNESISKATANATDQVGQSGALNSVLWLLILVLAAITVFMYMEARKATNEKQAAVQKAVQAAQVEWAKQQAVDNGHYESLLKDSRERERDLQNRHDAITRELRQQESKTVEVLSAVRGVLSQLNGGVMTVQHQLQSIESLITGRPATIRPPILPNDTPL